LVRRLRIVPDAVTSESHDAFLVVRCHDERGVPLVLKYAAATDADARRRLANEAVLVKTLPARPQLRLLRYRDHGEGYLLTELDSGRLLRPGTVEGSVLVDIADALVQFQAIPVDPVRLGLVRTRGRVQRHVRVLVKHLVHLWPEWMGAADSSRCLAVLVRSLPGIMAGGVPSHGDFLPTNLLYHDEERVVTFTDLERFAPVDHPLVDVLALFTIEDGDITNWQWQRRFLHHYLANSSGVAGLDTRSPEFSSAYRGLLTLFLAYRLNEALVIMGAGRYFENGSKRAYVARKVGAALRGRAPSFGREMTPALQMRQQNLRRVLSRDGYGEHLAAMGLPIAS
jgi:hypothetical protein